MLRPVSTTPFKKDIKKAKKQGKDCSKLKQVTDLLIREKPLAAKHRDHSLTGNYKNYRACHIEPDWLLIYIVKGEEIIFERLGTHSELFQKQRYN